MLQEEVQYLGEAANGLFTNGGIILQREVVRPESLNNFLDPGSSLDSHLLRLWVDIQDLVHECQTHHGLVAEGDPIGGQGRSHASKLAACIELF